MAYAPTRSCNDELKYGINDGVYKDSHINWANIKTDETCLARKQMSQTWHGFDEASVKFLPDGRSYATKGHPEIAPIGWMS